MSKPILTAMIAAAAFTATVADARTSASKRGVMSGAENRERAATRDLNAQQLSGTAAMAAAPATGVASDVGTPPMATSDSGTTGTTGAGTATPADTVAPATPDAMGPAMPAPDTAMPADPASPPR